MLSQGLRRSTLILFWPTEFPASSWGTKVCPWKPVSPPPSTLRKWEPRRGRASKGRGLGDGAEQEAGRRGWPGGRPEGHRELRQGRLLPGRPGPPEEKNRPNVIKWKAMPDTPPGEGLGKPTPVLSTSAWAPGAQHPILTGAGQPGAPSPALARGQAGIFCIPFHAAPGRCSPALPAAGLSFLALLPGPGHFCLKPLHPWASAPASAGLPCPSVATPPPTP